MAVKLEDVHKRYLERLRCSGETNMYGATPNLMRQFGFDSTEAAEILAEWMNTYNKDDYLSAEQMHPAAVAVMEPQDIGHHYGDLYLKKTLESKALVKRYLHAESAHEFKDQITGDTWYDIPFCFQYHVAAHQENVREAMKFWKELEDIPMNPETECFEVDVVFNTSPDETFFSAGTHREDVWHWFENTFGVSVAKDLMKI